MDCGGHVGVTLPAIMLVGIFVVRGHCCWRVHRVLLDDLLRSFIELRCTLRASRFGVRAHRAIDQAIGYSARPLLRIRVVHPRGFAQAARVVLVGGLGVGIFILRWRAECQLDRRTECLEGQ